MSFFLIFSIDTQLLVRCNLRSRETRQLFIIIGAVIVCLLVGLFLLLDSSATENSAQVTNEHHENHEYYQNVKKRHISRENANFVRIKRQTNIDPVGINSEDQNVRKKRLSEQLQHVKMQFERCRNSKTDKSGCERFYRQMIAVSAALNQEIQTIGEIAHNFPTNDQSERQNIDIYRKTPELSAAVGNPLHEFNREDSVLQRVSEFTPFPRFHEELNDGRVSLWNIDEPSKNTQHDMPNPPFPPPAMRADARLHPIPASPRDNDKVTPLKNTNFGMFNFDVLLARHFYKIH